MNNICIFYYDGFAEFEVVIAGLLMRKKNIFSTALTREVVVSEEKQKFVVDKAIGELSVEEVDMFIIPGGNPLFLYENVELKGFLEALVKAGKLVAGVCGGAELLAAYGILDGRRCTGDGEGFKPETDYYKYLDKAIVVSDDVVVDQNVVTAKGKAFIDFSVRLARIAGAVENDADELDTANWLKNL